jgi:hypothetical protein
MRIKVTDWVLKLKMTGWMDLSLSLIALKMTRGHFGNI